MNASKTERERARDAVLDCYESHAPFQEELEEGRYRHRSALTQRWDTLAGQLAGYAGWSSPVDPEELGIGLSEHVAQVPSPFQEYFDDLWDRCRRWGLDFNWALTELMWRDYYWLHPELLSRSEAAVDETVSMAQGLPPYLLVKVPTSMWLEQPKKNVQEFVFSSLQRQMARPARLRRAYKFDQYADWLFARNALNKTPAQITVDQSLNPSGKGKDPIEEALREFIEMLGGAAPRRGGAPAGKPQIRRL